MAEQQSPLTSFGDPSKINPYNASDEAIKKYQDALQSGITSLEQRYAQPNLFKVSEAFLKPQLGGFAASLGSAMGAMGENTEQQRAQQLPISQLKAQLAQSEIIMDANKKASQMASEHKGPITGEYVHELEKIAPNAPVTIAARKTYESQIAERQLAHNELADAQARVAYAYSVHMPPNPKDLAIINSSSSTQPPVAGFPQATPKSDSSNPPKTSDVIDASKDEKGKKITLDFPDKTTAEAMNIIAAMPKEEHNKIIEAMRTGNLILNTKENAKEKPVDTPTTKPDEPKYYEMNVARPDLKGVNPNDVQYEKELKAKRAASLEAPLEENYKRLSFVNSGEHYHNAVESNEAAMEFIRTNKKISNKVFNLVNQKGAIAAAANEGLGIHIGPYGASLNFPVEAMLKAGLSPEEQTAANILLNHIANSAYYNVISKGIDPTTAGSDKLALLMQQEPTMKSTVDAAYHNLQKNKNFLQMQHDIYNLYSNQTKVNPNSLTPFSDIKRSQDMQIIMKKHRNITKAHEDALRKSFTEKQP